MRPPSHAPGQFTEEQIKMAQLMARRRHKARAIKNMLDNMANEASMPITWTVDDVYDHFLRLGLGQKAQDAAGLDALFKERTRNGLPAEIHVNDDCVMTGAFWVLKDGVKRWSHCEHRTVLFDTKHGTNAHDFKLGCFCIVDEHGKTHVIAARC